MGFEPGQKVVCVRDKWKRPNGLRLDVSELSTCAREGVVYTVAGVERGPSGLMFLLLSEVADWAFDARDFRPVVEDPLRGLATIAAEPDGDLPAAPEGRPAPSRELEPVGYGFAEDGPEWGAPPRSFKPVKPRLYGSTEEAVARAYDQAGGVKRAAARLGLSLTQAYALADPDTRDRISLDGARRLSSVTPVFAELLASDAGGVFAPLEPVEASLEELAALNAELLARQLALRERRRTRTDRAHLARLCDRIAACAAAMARQCGSEP